MGNVFPVLRIPRALREDSPLPAVHRLLDHNMNMIQNARPGVQVGPSNTPSIRIFEFLPDVSAVSKPWRYLLGTVDRADS